MFIQIDELAKAKSIIMLCDEETNKHAEMLVHALVISAQMQSRRHNFTGHVSGPYEATKHDLSIEDWLCV